MRFEKEKEEVDKAMLHVDKLNLIKDLDYCINKLSRLTHRYISRIYRIKKELEKLENKLEE